MLQDYQLVVGLEIHVQMDTKTKLLCSCDNESFGVEPNKNTCPICQGFPGMLPKVNEEAIRFGVKTALALQSRVASVCRFDRKNYFYPDLPTGYQVTQFFYPICEGGFLDVVTEAGTQHIRLHHMHIECDAGKLVHTDQGTLLDFNRAGTPLMEIVTEPDFRDTETVKQFLQDLQKLLRAIGVSRVDMEKGHMRCDANVSLMKKGSTVYGTRCEIKNLNSFTHAVTAILYEAQRQAEVLDAGGIISQETRGFDVEKGKTFTLRSKEDALDYRYFPEPDLPPVVISPEFVAAVAATLPELPQAMQTRFIEQYGLKHADAVLLASDPALATYYEQMILTAHDAQKSANWLLSVVLAYLKETGIALSDFTVSPQTMGQLVALIVDGSVSSSQAKEIFAHMCQDPSQNPKDIAQKHGLLQMTDTNALRDIVVTILSENEKQAQEYRSGNERMMAFFVWQVMKKTGGTANPAVATTLLKELLSS